MECSFPCKPLTSILSILGESNFLNISHILSMAKGGNFVLTHPVLPGKKYAVSSIIWNFKHRSDHQSLKLDLRAVYHGFCHNRDLLWHKNTTLQPGSYWVPGVAGVITVTGNERLIKPKGEDEGAYFSTKYWDCRNRADLIETATPCHDAQVVRSCRVSKPLRLTTLAARMSC